MATNVDPLKRPLSSGEGKAMKKKAPKKKESKRNKKTKLAIVSPSGEYDRLPSLGIIVDTVGNHHEEPSPMAVGSTGRNKNDMKERSPVAAVAAVNSTAPTTSSSDAVELADDDAAAAPRAHKKTRRSKRGKSSSAIAAPADNVDAPVAPAPADVNSTATNSTAPAQHTEDDHELAEDAPSAPHLHKKTRRSKKGKSSIVASAPVDHVAAPLAARSTNAANDTDDQPRIEWTAASTSIDTNEDPQAASVLRSKPGFAPIGKPDNDLREYFLQMERLMEDQEFDSREDLLLFIENAYRELADKELVVACDFEGSRIVEKLLRGSSDVLVRCFSSRLAGFIPRLLVHQYGSHVVQSILLLAADIVDREVMGVSDQPVANAESNADADEPQQPPPPSMESILLSFCSELDGCWSELLMDPYASHVIRALLHVLSGEPPAALANVRSKKSANYGKNHNLFGAQAQQQHGHGHQQRHGTARRRTPSSFESALNSIAQSLVDSVRGLDLDRMAVHPVASPLLQFLMDIPQSANTLIPTIASNDHLMRRLIDNDVGSHLVERLVTRASADTFNAIYAEHIRPRFLDLCNHRIANYVIQSALDRIQLESQLKDAIDALAPSFDSLLFHGRAGVIVKTVAAAARFPSCQARMMQLLYQAVHVTSETDPTVVDPEKIKKVAEPLLYLTTLEKVQILELAPSVQGALILQHIAEYQTEHSRACIDSIIASTSPENLMQWATHAIASRVLEAFLAPTSFTPKPIRRRLARQFIGKYTHLASDKYGSHLLEKCWAVSGLDLRQTITEELASKSTVLHANYYGKFAIRNCRVELFVKRRDEWLSIQKIDIQKQDRVPRHVGVTASGSVMETTSAAPVADTAVVSDAPSKRRKRAKTDQMDEIDQVFAKKRI